RTRGGARGSSRTRRHTSSSSGARPRSEGSKCQRSAARSSAMPTRPHVLHSANTVSTVSYGWLDARVRAAVERAVADDPNPTDPLRGLYISDEQALALATEEAPTADVQLAEAVRALAVEPLDAAVLGLCAAPELDPRY